MHEMAPKESADVSYKYIILSIRNRLEALDPNAYAAFHASHNLQDVVERCLKKSEDIPGLSRSLSIKTRVMTPVKPMLAEACKSFASAIKKCPKGMFAEIKYDGERVQVLYSMLYDLNLVFSPQVHLHVLVSDLSFFL